jgi:NAD(P)H-hydrate epimerase
MAIVKAGAVLALEPQKYCLYNPRARPYAGRILPVGTVFPSSLVQVHAEAELLEWDRVGAVFPPVPQDVYKNERGLVEIRAGAVGTTGAAALAARGAVAAGAGLVRLVVDRAIYPILASSPSGVMVLPDDGVVPASLGEAQGLGPYRKGDALLLGPGWGADENRRPVLEAAFSEEARGVPLVLDAGAIALAKGRVFHGKGILTPHPGEFASFTGSNIEDILSNPVPLLVRTALEIQAIIMLKGHVITIVATDGRWGLVDGMCPVLASGGSGDLLAGFCAALAARMIRQGGKFDAYACVAAASSLLIAAARSFDETPRFTDPMEIAGRAADLAGAMWLGRGVHG